MNGSGLPGGSDDPLSGFLDAKGFANFLLDWAEVERIDVTPMKLQKLMFFCAAECASIFDVRLLRQDFEAWDYGPVIPSLYQEFKSEDRNPIKKRAMQFNPKTLRREIIRSEPPAVLLDVIRATFDIYAPMSAERLSDISHVYSGPWHVARDLFARGMNMDRRISYTLVRKQHQRILQ